MNNKKIVEMIQQELHKQPEQKMSLQWQDANDWLMTLQDPTPAAVSYKIPRRKRAVKKWLKGNRIPFLRSVLPAGLCDVEGMRVRLTRQAVRGMAVGDILHLAVQGPVFRRFYAYDFVLQDPADKEFLTEEQAEEHMKDTK
jgi:hypothetical protein